MLNDKKYKTITRQINDLAHKQENFELPCKQINAMMTFCEYLITLYMLASGSKICFYLLIYDNNIKYL